MSVSVIIPTYNRADQLARCLRGLVTQTYRDFEAIVCDDGSTDNTREVVAQFQEKLNLVYDYAPNWGGPAAPRNRGIQLARYPILAFLDSDDWWYPEKLAQCLPLMQSCDLLYHDLALYKKEGISQGIVKGRRLHTPAFTDMLLRGNPIPNSSVVIRRELVNKVGFFTEEKDLIAVEDADYWLRAAQHTERFCYLERTLGGYWVGAGISASEIHAARLRNLRNKFVHLLDAQDRQKAIMFGLFSEARTYHSLSCFTEAKKAYQECIKDGEAVLRWKAVAGWLLASFRIIM